MGSRRRLLWLARLLLYPTAIALVVLAWHERGPSADAEGGEGPTHTRVGRSGRTTQGEPMTAIVRAGRLVAFDTHLRLRCLGGGASPLPMRLRWRDTVPARGSDGAPTFGRGGTVWQMTWLPVVGPANTVVNSGPVAPSNDHPRAGGAATSIITAELVGETLTGTLLTSIALQRADGSRASCSATGVRFTLRPG